MYLTPSYINLLFLQKVKAKWYLMGRIEDLSP